MAGSTVASPICSICSISPLWLGLGLGLGSEIGLRARGVLPLLSVISFMDYGLGVMGFGLGSRVTGLLLWVRSYGLGVIGLVKSLGLLQLK